MVGAKGTLKCCPSTSPGLRRSSRTPLIGLSPSSIYAVSGDKLASRSVLESYVLNRMIR